MLQNVIASHHVGRNDEERWNEFEFNRLKRFQQSISNANSLVTAHVTIHLNSTIAFSFFLLSCVTKTPKVLHENARAHAHSLNRPYKSIDNGYRFTLFSKCSQRLLYAEDVSNDDDADWGTTKWRTNNILCNLRLAPTPTHVTPSAAWALHTSNKFIECIERDAWLSIFSRRSIGENTFWTGEQIIRWWTLWTLVGAVGDNTHRIVDFVRSNSIESINRIRIEYIIINNLLTTGMCYMLDDGGGIESVAYNLWII